MLGSNLEIGHIFKDKERRIKGKRANQCINGIFQDANREHFILIIIQTLAALQTEICLLEALQFTETN